jgi:hypothetical protein
MEEEEKPESEWRECVNCIYPEDCRHMIKNKSTGELELPDECKLKRGNNHV